MRRALLTGTRALGVVASRHALNNVAVRLLPSLLSQSFFSKNLPICHKRTSSSLDVPFTPPRSVAEIGTHCPGCGAPFQQSDPSKPGFLPESEPKKEPKKRKRSNKSLSDEEYRAILSNLDPETRSLLNESIEEEEEVQGKKSEENAENEKNGLEEQEQEQEQLQMLQKPMMQEEDTTSRRVCQRCFHLEHYNRITTDTSPEFLRATQQYGSLDFLRTKRNPLIVAILDISDLPFSLGRLPQLISDNPSARVILACNKADILPQEALRHEQRIRDWITQHVKQLGLPTKQILHVGLVSAKKGWGIPGLLRRIAQERMPTDDVYLVGCTNVGKSAIINQIVSKAVTRKDIKNKYKITSSPAPGTTMGTIRIPFHALGIHGNVAEDSNNNNRRPFMRERHLIDTPGIINDQQLIHLLPFNDQKKLLKQGEFKPVTFRVEPGKSLLLKPLVRIDVVEAPIPLLFTLFTPLNPHITKTEKLDTQAHIGHAPKTSLLDPSVIRLDNQKPIPDLLIVRGTHRSHASVDLAFASVGWVAIVGEFERAALRIWLPDKVDPFQAFSVRDPPLLPYEYKGVIRKFFGAGERARK